MLGLSALSARPISGGPFALFGFTAAMAAVGGFSFSGSAPWLANFAGVAHGTLTFSGSARWSSLNALTSSGGFSFSGSPILRVAGRPIVFFARADNFTFRGMR